MRQRFDFSKYVGMPIARQGDLFAITDKDSGEVLLEFFPTGNFPIIDQDGLFQGFPGRLRTRDSAIVNGKLVADPNPVEAFIEFQHNETTAQKLQRMLKSAEGQAILRREAYRLSQEEGPGEFEEELEDDEIASAHDLVYDEVAEKEVPRTLLGRFKKRPSPEKAGASGDAPLDQEVGGAPSASEKPAKQE